MKPRTRCRTKKQREKEKQSRDWFLTARTRRDSAATALPPALKWSAIRNRWFLLLTEHLEHPYLEESALSSIGKTATGVLARQLRALRELGTLAQWLFHFQRCSSIALNNDARGVPRKIGLDAVFALTSAVFLGGQFTGVTWGPKVRARAT